MGNSLSNIVDKFQQREREHRIICSGLDGAGKTTLMYMLGNGEVKPTIPTIGFNVEEIMSGKMNIISWDVGGRCNMRPLLRHYYESTSGIVFILDISVISSDNWYREVQKSELERLLAEPALIGLPLLILGNKVDLPSAMSQEELENYVNLKSMQRTRPVAVRRVSVSSYKSDPEPIKKAFSWLKDQVHPAHKSLLPVSPVA